MKPQNEKEIERDGKKSGEKRSTKIKITRAHTRPKPTKKHVNRIQTSNQKNFHQDTDMIKTVRYMSTRLKKYIQGFG